MVQSVHEAAAAAALQALGQLLAVRQDHLGTAPGGHHAGEAHTGTDLKPQRVRGDRGRSPTRGSRQGERGGERAVPPALACRAGSACAPTGIEPGPRRRATRTCRTASPAPARQGARRCAGVRELPPFPVSRLPPVPRARARPGPPDPPRSGTAARAAAAPPPWANGGQTRIGARPLRPIRASSRRDVTRSAAAGADGDEALAQRRPRPGAAVGGAAVKSGRSCPLRGPGGAGLAPPRAPSRRREETG